MSTLQPTREELRFLQRRRQMLHRAARGVVPFDLLTLQPLEPEKATKNLTEATDKPTMQLTIQSA